MGVRNGMKRDINSSFKRNYSNACRREDGWTRGLARVPVLRAGLGTEAVEVLSGSFPPVFPEKLGAILEKGGPAMANLDWSQCPAVESIPGKVSGAWVLRGTRMPVAAIFENIEAGANIDDIMEWFDGLDREQVKAVIEFAVRSLDKAPAC
jgi:uncharacterized protein (DUF433 family)